MRYAENGWDNADDGMGSGMYYCVILCSAVEMLGFHVQQDFRSNAATGLHASWC